MDNKISYHTSPIPLRVIQFMLIIFISIIIGIMVNNTNEEKLFILYLIIFSLIACIILYLLNKKLDVISLRALLLGSSIFLYSIGRTSLGSIDIFDRQVPIHLVVFPLLLILFIAQILTSDYRASLEKNLLVKEAILAAIFLVPLYASIFVASNTNSAFMITAELSLYIFIYFVFSFLVNSYDLLKKLIWIYVITTLIILLNSIYLFFYSHQNYTRLVSGDKGHANTYGMTLMFGFLFLFGLVISEKKWKNRILYSVILSFYGFGLFLTFSRTAWFSVSIAVIVLLLLSLKIRSFRKKIPRLFLYFVVLVSIAIFVNISSNTLVERLVSSLNRFETRVVDSDANRFSMYYTQLEYSTASPVLGVGLGQVIIEDYVAGKDLKNPHSGYLGVLAGSGTFALIFLLLFLIQHGLNLLRIRKQINQEGYIGNILFVTFVAFIVYNFFQTGFFDSIFWGTMAFQGAAINVYSNEKLKSPG